MSTTRQVLETIEHLRSGAAMTLSEALRMTGLAHKLFRRAVRNTKEIAELYDEAIDASYDILADKLVHINEYYPDPKVANSISRNIQWYLEKKKPDAYGAHSTIEHRINMDKDVLEALLRAKARAQTIDYEVPKALPHPTRKESTAEAREGYLAMRDAIRNRPDSVEDITPESDDTDISSLL